MKIAASKKIVIVLIICVTLLVLGITAFVYKDVISNGIRYGAWFTIDKHEDLLEHCEWEREVSGLKIHCSGLLEYISSSKDNKEDLCFHLQLISKRNRKLFPYVFCENEKNARIENPYDSFTQNKVLPIDLVLYTHKQKKEEYHIEKVEFLGSKGEDFFKKWDSNEDNANAKIGYQVKLLGEFPTKAVYDGIELLNHQDIFGEIRLYNVSIKKKYLLGDDIYLELEGYIDGQTTSYNATVKTKEVHLKSKDTSPIQVDSSNYETIPECERCTVSLVYITKSTKKQFEELCNNDIEGLPKEVCGRKVELQEVDYETMLKDGSDFIQLLKELKGKLYEKRGLIILNITDTSIL